jgi:hypothetical protein
MGCASRDKGQRAERELERGVIEITPAMISAALRIYKIFDPDFDSETELIRDLFVAMIEAQQDPDSTPQWP